MYRLKIWCTHKNEKRLQGKIVYYNHAVIQINLKSCLKKVLLGTIISGLLLLEVFGNEEKSSEREVKDDPKTKTEENKAVSAEEETSPAEEKSTSRSR